jgi:hypothetical protein
MSSLLSGKQYYCHCSAKAFTFSSTLSIQSIISFLLYKMSAIKILYSSKLVVLSNEQIYAIHDFDDVVALRHLKGVLCFIVVNVELRLTHSLGIIAHLQFELILRRLRTQIPIRHNQKTKYLMQMNMSNWLITDLSSLLSQRRTFWVIRHFPTVLAKMNVVCLRNQFVILCRNSPFWWVWQFRSQRVWH